GLDLEVHRGAAGDPGYAAEGRRGVGDDLAGERGRLEVGERERLGGEGVGLAAHQPELEHGLLADEVQGALLVVGGEAGQLDDDVPVAGGLHQGLGDAELVDAVLDDVARGVEVLAQRVRLLGLEGDAQAAVEVEAELQRGLAGRPRLPQVEDGSDHRREDEDACRGPVHATGTSTSSYTSMMSPSWMFS